MMGKIISFLETQALSESRINTDKEDISISILQQDINLNK